MSNEITAYFKGTSGVSESVYQFDYGMIMIIDGPDLTAPFEVHFEHTGGVDAVTAIGQDNRVAIPNACLALPGRVTAYIYDHTGQHDGQTAYVVRFQVMNRARPVDEVTDEQDSAISKAIALLAEPIDNIETIVNEALAFTGPAINSLDARITNLARLSEGSTTGDAELTDARVVGDITYDTLHQAIDTELSNLKSDLKYTFDTIDANEVNGEYLTTDNGAGIIRRDNGTYNTSVAVWKHETISVNPNELYRISGVSTNDTFCLAVFLDSNDRVVGYTEDYTGSQIIYTDVLIRVPQKATKMVVNTNTDLFAQAKVRKIEIDPISNQVTHVVKPIFSALDDDGYSELSLAWSMGFINQNTGAYTPRGTGICTPDVINLSEDNFIINNHTAPLRVYRFYADGTYMQLWAVIQPGRTLKINVPINVKLSLDSSPTPDYKSTVIVKSKKYQALDLNNDEYLRIFPKWESGALSSADGSKISSASSIVTSDLLHSNGSLKLSNLHDDVLILCRYTSDGTYIDGSYKSINAGASWVQEGDCYFKLSLASATSEIDSNDLLIKIIRYAWMSQMSNFVDNGSYWAGKKIVWFGTSIPAGVVNAGDANGNGAYPERLGRMLGATVYNESVGSSQVRAGSYHNKTADDPMGYGGCSAVSLLYSLSLSSAEKQDIIDNWNSKWSSIITWFGSLVDLSKANEYKASSWDVKLTKYLTGGSVGPCDLYVFDHGYNDGIYQRGFTDLSDVPADAEDRTYFLGAMQFLIDKILADNPKAKILFIGHYCTDGRSGNFLTKYVTDAQKKLAEIWQYPLIETWKYMGFNHVPITVDNVQTTVAQQWMPDDIHPSSDTTGEALKHYAEVLYPLVRDVR